MHPPFNTHRFDPCCKCGVGHDDHKVGPCPGPNQSGYKLYLADCGKDGSRPLSYDKWVMYSTFRG